MPMLVDATSARMVGLVAFVFDCQDSIQAPRVESLKGVKVVLDKQINWGLHQLPKMKMHHHSLKKVLIQCWTSFCKYSRATCSMT